MVNFSAIVKPYMLSYLYVRRLLNYLIIVNNFRCLSNQNRE